MATPKKILHWYLLDDKGKPTKRRFTSKTARDKHSALHPDAKFKEHLVAWQAVVWNNRIKKNDKKNFPTKADAAAWSDERKDSVRKGKTIDHSRKLDSTLFNDFIDMYDDHQKDKVAEGKIAQSTYDSKEYRINTIKDFFGEYYLSELTDDAIYDYAKVRNKEVSMGSVKKELAIISHAINLSPLAFKLKGLENVVKLASPTLKDEGYIGSDNKRNRRLRPNEEEQILNTPTKSIYCRAAFGFAAETAIRRTELSNCTRYQITYDIRNEEGKFVLKTESWVNANNIINKNPDFRMVKQVNRRKRYYQPDNRILHISAEQSKTGESRDIYLSDKAIAFIEKIPPSVCGRLFPASPNTFTQWLKRILKRSENRNIVDLHWHDLRHEGTTRYILDKGFSIEEAQLSTGHAELESLQRYIEIRTSDVVERKQGIR